MSKPRWGRLRTAMRRALGWAWLLVFLSWLPMAQAAQSPATLAPTTLAREVAGDLIEGRMAAVVSRMSSDMAAALPEEKLRAIWTNLTRQLGPPKGLGEAWSESEQSVSVIRVPVLFPAVTLDLKISIASEKIVGFFIMPHEEPHAAWAPPAYADMSSFDEVGVTVGSAPLALPGTLSLPHGVAKPPVVILVHGSGPQDRDETIGPNKVFRDLAFGLASRGIAVLRYEKRTKIHPGSFVGHTDFTVREEVLDDVGLAIDLLKSRQDIDADRILVLGHSLGGTLAPRIAAANAAVSRIAILAGATRPLPEIIVRQADYLSGLSGRRGDAETASLEQLRREAARALAARPGDAGPPALGVPLSYWADLNAYDPASAAAALTIPILVLQGGRDYQVTVEDFDRFRSALGGRDRAELHLLPELNHQFMAGTGRSTPAEYQVPGHVAPGVIDLIARFVLAASAPK